MNKRTNNDYEGHSPETCNYQECHGDSTTKCPFVKDDTPPNPFRKSCNHEWRFLSHLTTLDGLDQSIKFYCIYCLDIKTKPIML